WSASRRPRRRERTWPRGGTKERRRGAPADTTSLQLEEQQSGANELLYSVAAGDPERQRAVLTFCFDRQIKKRAAYALGRNPICNFGKRNGFGPKSKPGAFGDFPRIDPGGLHFLHDLLLVSPLLFRQRFFQAAGKGRF